MKTPFCSHCENMLYIKIKEDDSNAIEFFCRLCNHVEPHISANSTILSSNVITQPNFSHIINEYTKFDPTLPRIHMTCPNENCLKEHTNKEQSGKQLDKVEVIYIRYDDKRLKYLYLCTECDFVWSNNQPT